jgi:hypothetical protein
MTHLDSHVIQKLLRSIRHWKASKTVSRWRTIVICTFDSQNVSIHGVMSASASAAAVHDYTACSQSTPLTTSTSLGMNRYTIAAISSEASRNSHDMVQSAVPR